MRMSLCLGPEIFFLQCAFRAQVASLIRHRYHAEQTTMSSVDGLWSSTHWEAQRVHRLHSGHLFIFMCELLNF